MGGGKSGGSRVVAPQALPTTTKTSIGNKLDAPTVELKEEDIDRASMINKKRKGTRGLQIPLNTDESAPVSASSTGISL